MIALTIDCEQWNSPLLRGKDVAENNNTQFSKKGNEHILRILDKFKIKATFFVTGYFAEREPAQVKKIFSKGHEIACHGYNHFYRGNKKFDLEEDILKSKRIIEDIIGKKIIGFRAPQLQFSLMLLKILNKAGFRYDSSLHPAFFPGVCNNARYPIGIYKPIDDLFEIPLGVMPFTRLPISWVFMRNIGNWWTKLGCSMLLSKNIVPNLYVHSWEFIEMKSEYVPFYFTRNTGKVFCRKLEDFIGFFGKQKFIRLCDILPSK